MAAAQAEFAGYMSDHITAKRARPSDDLLSSLLEPGAQGGGLSDRKLVATGQVGLWRAAVTPCQ